MILLNDFGFSLTQIFQSLFSWGAVPVKETPNIRAPHQGPSLASRLRMAKKAIRAKDNLVAKAALNILESGEVEIRYFRDMTKKDFLSILKVEDFAFVQQKKYSYPLNQESVDIVEKSALGMCCGHNRIYLSANLSDKVFTDTLIHELSHYFRRKTHKESPCEAFMDELRSYLNEGIFNDKRISRNRVQWLFEHVKKAYPELKTPQKATLPEDLYFHVLTSSPP